MKPTTITIVCCALLLLTGLAAPPAAACTATWTCTAPYIPDHLSCTGTICMDGPNFVECNGVRQECIYCPTYASCHEECQSKLSTCLMHCDLYLNLKMPDPCQQRCDLFFDICMTGCEIQCS